MEKGLLSRVLGIIKYFQVFYHLWAHNPKVVGSNPSPATKKQQGLQHSVLAPFMILLSFTFFEPMVFIHVSRKKILPKTGTTRQGICFFEKNMF